MARRWLKHLSATIRKSLSCSTHDIGFSLTVDPVLTKWSAPIIDYLPGSDTPTIRAFYPVRAFPAMANEDVGRCYDALRLFHKMADQPEFELKFRLTAGDIMCFDNRRVLHGRDAFTGSGKHLQGIYIDRDEIMSRGRAQPRAAGSNGS